MLQKCCTQYASQQIWKTQQWPQDWKRSGFIPIPKKGNTKECSDCHTIALTSHAQSPSSSASTVRELRNSRCISWVLKRQRNQRSGCQHPLTTEKTAEFQKNIFFCFSDYAKTSDYVDRNKLENSSRDGNARPSYLSPKKSVCRIRSNS